MSLYRYYFLGSTASRLKSAEACRRAGPPPRDLSRSAPTMPPGGVGLWSFLLSSDFPYKIIIATTNICNGNTMIKSLVYEIENKLVRDGTPVSPEVFAGTTGL